MKKFLTVFLALIIAAASFSMAGCTRTNGKSKIVLCEVTHSVFYAPQYLAMSLGYFEDAGIEISLTNGEGADKVMAALLSGSAQIGLMGPEACIYVNAAGDSNQPVVFGQLTKRDGSFLVGRDNETGFDWSNLHGKEVLMGRQGGVPAMTLQYILNNHGYVDGENITMRYIQQFAMLGPEFISGKGDYVPLFEPTATNLVNQGEGYIVASIGQESGSVPYTAYAAKPSYLSANADLLEKFLDCVYRATKYLMENDDETAAGYLTGYSTRNTKAEIVTALKAYKANDTWKTTPVMDEEDYNRLQAIMENAGELDRRVSFDVVVDNGIANKIGK